MAKAVDPTKPVELTARQRLEQFLATLQLQYKHSGPITSAHLKELADILAMNAGKPVVVQHPFPSYAVSGGGADKVGIVFTAEEALAVIRALNDDVRALPHWVAAEKAVLSFIDTNEGGLAAQTAFETAVATDQAANPKDAPEIERLPDGRVREDRFPDRKLVAPVAPSTPPLVTPVAPVHP